MVTTSTLSVRMQKTLQRLGSIWEVEQNLGFLRRLGTGPGLSPSTPGGLTSRSAPPPFWSLLWRWLVHEGQGFCLNSLRVSLPESQLWIPCQKLFHDYIQSKAFSLEQRVFHQNNSKQSPFEKREKQCFIKFHCMVNRNKHSDPVFDSD